LYDQEVVINFEASLVLQPFVNPMSMEAGAATSASFILRKLVFKVQVVQKKSERLAANNYNPMNITLI